MYYTVYKITNKINNKIYIGVHKTSVLEDDYMGSGKHLKHAQEKYGIENFEKEILEVFEHSAMMYQYEALLVNEEFVARDDTYNLKVGGFGGFDYLNKNKDEQYLETRKTFLGKKHSDETKMKMSESKKGKNKGPDNSQFSTMWIHNLDLKESKKIKKDEFPEYESLGWLKGRKMKF